MTQALFDLTGASYQHTRALGGAQVSAIAKEYLLCGQQYSAVQVPQKCAHIPYCL